ARGGIELANRTADLASWVHAGTSTARSVGARGPRMLAEATFTGRTALVTGGGTGLRLAIATQLGRLRARAVVASRQPQHIANGVEAVEAIGAKAIGVEVDVRDPDAVDAAFDRGEDRWGRPVQLVVNNAAGNFRVSALEMSPRAFRTVVDIVLNGTFH